MTDSNPTLRERLYQLLQIRCIFPYELGSLGSTARCMLENDGSKVLQYEETTEDVIAKVLDRTCDKESIKYILTRLFHRVPTFRELPGDARQFKLGLELRSHSNSLHPGIASIIKIYEHEDGVVLIQSYAKHSLLSLSRFHARTTLASPTLGRAAGPGSRDLRIRFIVYQLFQVIAFIHDQGLALGALKPADVMLDDVTWLTLPAGICNAAFESANNLVHAKERIKSDAIANGINEDAVTSKITRPIDFYEPLPVRWAKGKVSNFEYLMAVNSAAGRSMSDPLYHPILPWVTDFLVNLLPCTFHDSVRTASTSGLPCCSCISPDLVRKSYRDLSKSKFRLSKGDHQLETTFRHSDPSHHVPESLSELTYYIYLARRTPMQVLRRVVRDVFVPEHYPLSMARMYDWSPDECIPEFYSDVTVFDSIHKQLYGLPDLEIPPFLDSPAAFVAYHRAVLESDEVSKNLHLWLDLTFGHCLEGQAAIDNMNVPLKHTLSSSERMGDSPKLDKHPGFVMLFNRPHPQRHVTVSEYEFREAESNHFTNVEALNTLADTKPPVAQSFNLERSMQALVDISSNSSSSRRSANSASRYLAASGNSFNSVLASTSASSSLLEKQSGAVSSSSDANTTTNRLTVPSAVVFGVVDSRKSLSRPPADSSLLCLQVAGSIDISSSTSHASLMSLNANSDEYRFAAEFGALLEPVYSSCNSSHVSHFTEQKFDKPEDPKLWDADFFDALVSMYKRVLSTKVNDIESTTMAFRQRQATDMFSLGCVIAEVFMGQPLLGILDLESLRSEIGIDNETDIIRRTMKIVYRNASSLPLVIRRVICMLLLPDFACQPAAREILQACTTVDQETWGGAEYENQCFGGSEIGQADFSLFRSVAQRTNYIQGAQLSVGPVVELLDQWCDSLFPSYFKSIYTIIGRIKLCRKDASRLKVIIESLDELMDVPLEGLSLALPHLLGVLADPKPFRVSQVGPLSPQASSEQPTTPTSSSQPVGSNQKDSELPVISLPPPEEETLQMAREKDVKDDRHLENFLREYATIIDVLGIRLGLDGTEKLLVPAVLNFLNKLMSPGSLQILLDSSLWSILVLRTGVCCFLRHFLPSLLTYVVAGTLQRVSLQMDNGSPMWTNLVGAEQYEWLHACSLPDIRAVQMAAVAAIINLSDPSALGHGLCSRYVLPALLCLVSVPQLSAAGYGLVGNVSSLEEFKVLHGYKVDTTTVAQESKPGAGNRNIEGRRGGSESRPRDSDSGDDTDLGRGSVPVTYFNIESPADLEKLDKFVCLKAQYDPQDMYVVRGIVGLCVILGELVSAEVVISKIFNSVLPDLSRSLGTPLSSSITAAFMETVLLLNGILPTLSPHMVIKSLLMPAKSSGLSLPGLLNMIPLSPSWSVLDDNRTVVTSKDIESYIDYQRIHTLQLELCRLVVSSSMIAGPTACEEFVLPALDTFFGNFVECFGSIGIESKTISRAFELGSELFLPLAQFVGPESFYTAVSNLNPRLEMWLLSVGSGGARTSPPLPPNILPEVVQTNNEIKGRKKSIFQSIKSGWKSTFSNLGSSSSSNTQGTVPNSSAGHRAGRTASVDTFGESRSRALNFAPSTSKPSSGHGDTKVSHANMSSIQYDPDSLTDDFSGFSPVSDKPTLPLPSSVSYAQTITPGLLAHSSTPHSAGMELKPMTVTKSVTKALPPSQTPNPYDRLATQADTSPDIGSLPVLSSSSAVPISATFDSDDEEFEYEQSEPHLLRVVADSRVVDDPVPSISRTSGIDDSTGPGRQSVVDFGVNPGKVGSHEIALEESLHRVNNDSLRHIDMGSPDPYGNSNSLHSEDLAIEDFDIPMHRALGSDNFTLDRGGASQKYYLPSHTFKKIISGGFSNSQWIAKKKEKKTQTKMSLMLSSKPQSGEDEEDEAKELSYNDHAWLLAGKGRWNIAREVRAKKAKELRDSAVRGGQDGATKRLMALSESSSDSNWVPAAQISMTAPRIAVDVAAEAVSLFAFGMTCRTQWRIEESSPIRSLVVDNAEMLLLTTSKSGVKIFSLSSHPLKQITQYTAHASVPYCAAFMKSSFHVATCDGNINLWDLEYGKTLSILEQTVERGPYLFMESISPRLGVTPSLNAYGDDQLFTCAGSSILHYDFRVNAKTILKPVSDWVLPPLPVAYSNFSSNTSVPVQLTCAASQDKLIVAGSSSGGLWAIDRRMGRVLSSWQGHDSAVVKISSLDEKNFLSISDRSAFVWNCSDDSWESAFGANRGMSSGASSISNRFGGAGLGSGQNGLESKGFAAACTNFEMQRLYTIRNTPDGSIPLNSSTVLLHTFEQSSSSSSGMDIGIPSKPLNVLYCVCGHKMYAGRIPTVDTNLKTLSLNPSTATREVQDPDEIKLTQTYFCDRNKGKLHKQKLQVTSSVMLPLRRLLLLGTEDGLVRVIS